MESGFDTAYDAKQHAAWRLGDRHAATDLIVRYRPRLRRLGRQLGLSDTEAEDLAQQVLLEAPRSPFQPVKGSSYFAWLSTIARRRVAKMRVAATGESPVRRATTPWTAAWRTELFESIEAMPEPLRNIFWRLVAGYTPLEISQELGLPRTTVRVRIHRGRQWLKDRVH